MGGRDAPFIPTVNEEEFIWRVPEKWYPFSKVSDEKTDTYFFPTGQDPNNWDESLHFVHYTSTLGVTDAYQVYEIRTQGAAATCATHETDIAKQEVENGYSMMQWTDICVSSEGDFQYTTNKVVLGNEKLYMASKIWKSMPREHRTKRWHDYFDQTYVCDPTTENNPCRPPGRPSDRR